MQYRTLQFTLSIVAPALITIFAAGSSLSGCAGVKLPPIPVSFDVVLGVEIPALASVSGSADIPIDSMCALFNAAELEAIVRDEAGDMITDMVEITRIELVATDIVATEGTFAPFNTASFDVIDTEINDTLLLGTAANNDGLGTSFTLALDTPVDVLNDLDAADCDSPQLHLDGAGILEGEPITFDVQVTLLVYTEFTDTTNAG